MHRASPFVLLSLPFVLACCGGDVSLTTAETEVGEKTMIVQVTTTPGAWVSMVEVDGRATFADVADGSGHLTFHVRPQHDKPGKRTFDLVAKDHGMLQTTEAKRKVVVDFPDTLKAAPQKVVITGPPRVWSADCPPNGNLVVRVDGADDGSCLAKDGRLTIDLRVSPSGANVEVDAQTYTSDDDGNVSVVVPSPTLLDAWPVRLSPSPPGLPITHILDLGRGPQTSGTLVIVSGEHRVSKEWSVSHDVPEKELQRLGPKVLAHQGGDKVLFFQPWGETWVSNGTNSLSEVGRVVIATAEPRNKAKTCGPYTGKSVSMVDVRPVDQRLDVYGPGGEKLQTKRFHASQDCPSHIITQAHHVKGLGTVVDQHPPFKEVAAWVGAIE